MTRRGGRPGSWLSPKAVEYWREYEETLRELEQAANSDPAQFARRLLAYVAAMNQVRDEYIDYSATASGSSTASTGSGPTTAPARLE